MPQNVTHGSTFKAALPYGALALTAGAVGTVISLACAATALKVVGVILALLGAWTFFGILICGVTHIGKPDEFKKELPKVVTTIIGSMAAEMIQKLAVEVISGLLDKALGRQGSSIRLSGI